ncbi:pre-mRNA-splicing factor CWC25 homolog [Tigriopus californicus]|nr:pre-mRNA-splicing factor CWC25 homolog [Tigriopus californicus]
MTEWIRDANYGQATQEDYLLGQEIGPNFEQQGTMGQINAVEYDCTPQSIFASRAEHQVDLQRKLQEDPLLALKKRELDSRRAVLDNPIKLKAIQKKIEKMKKSKKKKKSKKRSRSSSSSSGSDDDQDLDAILMKKLGVMPDNPPATSDPATSSRSPQRHSSSPDSSPDRRKKPTHNTHRRPRSPRARRKPSRSPPTERRNRSPAASRRRRSRSPEPSRRPARSSRERGYRPAARSERGPRSISRSPEARKKVQSALKYRRDRSRSRDRRRSRSPARRSSHASKSRSKDEDDQTRENKLKEMMENAKWREDQRTKNVKHYRSLTAQEETDHLTRHDPDFIRLQLNRAAENATVEKRIRSNRHNIQRSGANMEQNFARR